VVFFRGRDARRAHQLVFLDDERLGQVGFDDAGRDRLDGTVIQAFAAHLRRQAQQGRLAAAIAFAWFIQRQAAARAVEVDDLARINPVRIADFVAVHAPDLGPAPGVLQEGAGNIPEGIALDHAMLVRGIWLEGAFGGLDGAGDDTRNERRRCSAGHDCAKIFH
jgi:hypothetical protein